MWDTLETNLVYCSFTGSFPLEIDLEALGLGIHVVRITANDTFGLTDESIITQTGIYPTIEMTLSIEN